MKGECQWTHWHCRLYVYRNATDWCQTDSQSISVCYSLGPGTRSRKQSFFTRETCTVMHLTAVTNFLYPLWLHRVFTDSIWIAFQPWKTSFHWPQTPSTHGKVVFLWPPELDTAWPINCLSHFAHKFDMCLCLLSLSDANCILGSRLTPKPQNYDEFGRPGAHKLTFLVICSFWDPSM